MKRIIQYIHDTEYDIYTHMAIDEILFDRMIRGCFDGAVFRTYHSRGPAITIGVGYRIKNDPVLMAKTDTPLTRRITGGGAVFHTADHIYSLVCPVSIHPQFAETESSYAFIHECMARVLTSQGIACGLAQDFKRSTTTTHCFTHAVKHDIICGNMKIAGAAQKRSHGYVLQQGSIQAVADGVCVSDMRMAEEVARACSCELKPYQVTDEDRERAQDLVQRKYAQREWIYRR